MEKANGHTNRPRERKFRKIIATYTTWLSNVTGHRNVPSHQVYIIKQMSENVRVLVFTGRWGPHLLEKLEP